MQNAGRIDDQVKAVIRENELRPIEPAPEFSPELVALGQALFFDKELSGNRDMACSTCHHPNFRTSDGLSLSVGEGGSGLGTERKIREIKKICRVEGEVNPYRMETVS